MSSTRVLLPLLLVALICSDGALMVGLERHDLSWPHLAAVSLQGWLLAQLTLLSFWLTQPKINLACKAFVGIGMHWAASHASASLTDGNPASWSIALGCFVLLSCLLLWLTRNLTTSCPKSSALPRQLVDSTQPAPASSGFVILGRNQFGLWELMSLTTAVCIVIGYCLQLRFAEEIFWPSMRLFGSLAVASSCSLWIALRFRFGFTSLLTFLLMGIAGTWYFSTDLNGIDTVSIFYLSLLQQAGVLALGLTMRLLQLDLFGVSIAGQPSQSDPRTSATEMTPS